jgi:hypothetical protein
MRDWITKHKSELKFVINFHCAGKQFVIPYSGKIPNTLAQEHPDIKKIFTEIVNDADFPDGTRMGPSGDSLKIRAGGDAGDWITHALGIPGSEYELGAWTDYASDWSPKSLSTAQTILDENLKWLEHIYDKIGN